MNEDMRQSFFKAWKKRFPSKEHLCYDITSISSYATGNEYVRYGYNRDGERLPQINLAVVYGQTSMLPMIYRELPGSIADVSTLKNTLDQFDKLDYGTLHLDVYKRQAQLDAFVAQKVDAVIISPVDADALAAAVKTVVDAGIPVITCSADVTGDQGQVWVGSANENGGEVQMRYVAERLGGKGKIAVLRGPLGAFAEQGRFAGYEVVINEYPDMEIVFDQTANWERDEAMA